VVFADTEKSTTSTSSSILKSRDLTELKFIAGHRSVEKESDYLAYHYLTPKAEGRLTNTLNNTSVLFVQMDSKAALKENILSTAKIVSRLDHFELHKDLHHDHFLAIVVGPPVSNPAANQVLSACIFDHRTYTLLNCASVVTLTGQFIGFGLVVPGNASAIEAVYKEDGMYRQIQYGLTYQKQEDGTKIIIPDKDGMLHKFDPIDALQIAHPMVSMPTPNALKVQNQDSESKRTQILYAAYTDVHSTFFIYDHTVEQLYRSTRGDLAGLNATTGCVHLYSPSSIYLGLDLTKDRPSTLKIPFFSRTARRQMEITINLSYLDTQHRHAVPVGTTDLPKDYWYQVPFDLRSPSQGLLVSGAIRSQKCRWPTVHYRSEECILSDCRDSPLRY